ncbi:hypothetical protein PROFUN_15348 [Planoprotostelium fungivorum]|uniref:Uncharacterized protein n=1 Tax=Planoprotostelium fungivorum TaxID=1890364 RepID=A0A2P6MWN0_9EUKA|nr:hypothetical protein PROFUN_15348 [Planoprotostelium fungivorum]
MFARCTQRAFSGCTAINRSFIRYVVNLRAFSTQNIDSRNFHESHCWQLQVLLTSQLQDKECFLNSFPKCSSSYKGPNITSLALSTANTQTTCNDTNYGNVVELVSVRVRGYAVQNPVNTNFPVDPQLTMNKANFGNLVNVNTSKTSIVVGSTPLSASNTTWRAWSVDVLAADTGRSMQHLYAKRRTAAGFDDKPHITPETLRASDLFSLPWFLCVNAVNTATKATDTTTKAVNTATKVTSTATKVADTTTKAADTATKATNTTTKATDTATKATNTTPPTGTSTK